jgi:hypothetical protein
MNKIQKAVSYAFIAVMAATMTTSTPVSAYAQTTEDDGYTYDSEDPEE